MGAMAISKYCIQSYTCLSKKGIWCFDNYIRGLVPILRYAYLCNCHDQRLPFSSACICCTLSSIALQTAEERPIERWDAGVYAGSRGVERSMSAAVNGPHESTDVLAEEQVSLSNEDHDKE